MATGLLVVLVGPATRLEPYLSSATKSYDAGISFGAATDTDDAEGAVIREAPVPEQLRDEEFARGVLARFGGESMQLPPSYSAIKVGGTTAHRAARAGTPVDLEKRPITVECSELTAVKVEPVRWDVSFRVSKGTYIRSLARDIGEATGSAAHLSSLVRTASGPLRLSAAHSLDEIIDAAARGALATLWSDPVAALGFPAFDTDRAAVSDGRPVTLPADVPRQLEADTLVALTARQPASLLAIYRTAGDRLVPEVVFPEGVSRGVL